ncbi:MAG: heparan-alpha-glucosaminide N-acetyltransferase [Pseudomonadota bacterium]
MTPAAPGRIPAVDWARTAAILGMVTFHFGRDLEVVGLVPPGTTFGGGWDIWARGVAGSFLFLAGLSLWLAHGGGIRWRGFLRRLGLLVAAALGVSIATYLVMPQLWVRFGILHAIALASVLALPFLKVPWWVTLAMAALVLFWAPGLRSEAFDGAWWLWLGLGTTAPPMMDWEPMVPWLAPMLAGVAAGRLGAQLGWWKRMKHWPDGPTWLAWPGRHSLAIYLVHQPVIIGGMLGWIWVTG